MSGGGRGGVTGAEPPWTTEHYVCIRLPPNGRLAPTLRPPESFKKLSPWLGVVIVRYCVHSSFIQVSNIHVFMFQDWIEHWADKRDRSSFYKEIFLDFRFQVGSTIFLKSLVFIFYRTNPNFIILKGVFAKNERGNRLNAGKKRFWSVLILLLSVASIRRKLLKTTNTEELSVRTNSERCNIQLGS